MRKGYHFLLKVYERITFSVKNGILKGEGLDQSRTQTSVGSGMSNRGRSGYEIRFGPRGWGSLPLENYLEYPPLSTQL